MSLHLALRNPTVCDYMSHNGDDAMNKYTHNKLVMCSLYIYFPSFMFWYDSG
jgi:hypothetical protein